MYKLDSSWRPSEWTTPKKDTRNKKSLKSGSRRFTAGFAWRSYSISRDIDFGCAHQWDQASFEFLLAASEGTAAQ
jgi:hypothetical protein